MKQEEALAILKTGANVFLTGEPGSGKTHTINQYVRWLNERGISPAVTASTGIAATHINGVTVHAWSGIGIRREVSDWDIEMIQSKEKVARRLIDAKVLIIDEISMLDAATLTSVDKVLRTLRHQVMREEEPFGGVQIIFVGDFFQLPPVSRNERAVFAFESAAWRDANPIVCYLSEQHRQEDGDFLDLLSALRHGTFTEKHMALLRARKHVRPKDEVATRLYTHNADVDRINNESLGKIKKGVRTFEMQSRGIQALVEMLKNNCLSPETLELKEGASVMFTRNNFEEGFVNGTLGTVVRFSDMGLPVVQTRNGKEIMVEVAEWSVQDGNKTLAAVTQIPLRLAWAITVHKSQGMSLDAAIVDLAQAFEFGQGYVAISRVRTLDGLFLEGFNDRALMLHPAIVKKDREFRIASDTARGKFSQITREHLEALHKNFLRGIGAREVKEVAAKAKSDSDGYAAIREKHPNAYKSWSNDDDSVLIKMFGDKKKTKEIAAYFGRQGSAIRARLMKLGLIRDFWKSRNQSKE